MTPALCNKSIEMGHRIATLCNGRRALDNGECDTEELLFRNGDGTTNTDTGVSSCVDVVVPQGSEGAHVMDNLVRDCLRCEPGARLHICVAYSLLRIEVIRKSIGKKERVFMPDHMILFVEPCDIPTECLQPGVSQAFMRVRVFRFLVLPSGVSQGSAKRKALIEDSESGDEEFVTPKIPNSSQTGHSSKTLRHRVR